MVFPSWLLGDKREILGEREGDKGEKRKKGKGETGHPDLVYELLSKIKQLKNH